MRIITLIKNYSVYLVLFFFFGFNSVVYSQCSRVANTVQYMCPGSTVANLQVTNGGAGYAWFSASVGGTKYILTDLIVIGNTYYADNANGNCGARIAVKTLGVTQPTFPPPYNSFQGFCGDPASPNTLNDIQITGSNIKWYDNSAAAGLSLPGSTQLTDGTIYYAASFSTDGNCKSFTKSVKTYLINVAPPTSANINPSQSFCNIASPKISNIITSIPVNWYDSSDKANQLDPNTPLVSGKYYAAAFEDPCESNTTFEVTVTVNTPPKAGTLSGIQNICTTGTTVTTLTSNGDPGGSWSSSNTSIVTVDAGGKVTAVAPGTAIITYTVTASAPCTGTATATLPITVNPPPNAGTISGIQNICTSGTTPFTSNGDAGGVWTSSNTGVATVNGSGIVTAIASGTSNITYTVTAIAPCAGTSAATRTLTVTKAPNAGTLSGTQNICTSGTTAFTSNGDPGGSWTSSAPAIATVDGLTGLVTGVTAGTATITYTVTGVAPCSNVSATRTVTVTKAPNAGTLSGTQNICTSGTTAFTSNGDPGGSWTSSAPTIATVNAATGLVTGVTAGTATITYTVTGTAPCSNVSSTRTVTVTKAPNAGTLSGIQNICTSGTTAFTSDGDPGGSWTTSAPAVATVDAATGLVTGVTAGTATITYTVTGVAPCPNVSVTRTVTVSKAPNAGTLNGTQNICTSGTTTFTSNGDPGGSWTSSAPTIATVNAATGLVTGVTPGTATITYTVTGTAPCSNVSATRTVTVTKAPNAGTLSGTQNICTSGTTAFTSDGDPGGAWTSSAPAIATVDAATGLVTGVTAGTATITYTVIGVAPCSNVSATRTVTVAKAPNAGTLSGTQNICTSGTATFTSNGDPGGSWTSSAPGIATVNAVTGLVTGVTAGTATITYTVIGVAPCSNVSATRTVTVTKAPNAGTLSGIQNICTSGTTAFTSDGDPGGSWTSSAQAIATVDAATGLVTGVTAGTATITYTVIGVAPCSNVSATRTVTVAKAPNAGTLSGTQNICTSGTATFTSNGDPGGSWTSSAPTIATVNAATGLVTGVTAGTATITYTIIGIAPCSDASATRTVTVTKAPNAGTLSGTQNICAAGTTAFTSDGDLGGSWTSSAPAIATVDAATGLITGITAGTATITYTVIGVAPCSNVSATRTVTIAKAPNAGTLSGTQNICTSGTATFTSNGDLGGSWMSSAPAIATVNAATGLVTGVTDGTVIITYTVTGTAPCSNVSVTRTVTVTKAPNAGTLSGTQNICTSDTTAFTSDGDPGGSWTSSAPAIATVDAATGLVTGVTAGTATITYTVTGTAPCSNVSATRTVTVTKAPNAGTLSGTQNICTSGTTAFTSNGDPGGAWTSSAPAIATVNAATGLVTGITDGTATITYTVAGTAPCANASATRTVTVTKAPNAGALSGTQNICTSDTAVFTTDGDTGGSWTSSNTTIATVDAATGFVTGVTAGTATITYTVTGLGGCINASSTRTVTVTKAPNAGTLSGTQAICVAGTSIYTSNGDTGGTWSSSDTSVAAVDVAGTVTSVAVGTANIKYTITGTGGCATVTATLPVTVTKPPTAGTLSGTQNICAGGTTIFTSDGDIGGSWSSSDTAIATVDAIGKVTGVKVGIATINYTVTGMGGCTDVTATLSITIMGPNAGTLSGNQAICIAGSSTITSNGDAGGSWTSSNTSIATVDATGVVTGIAAGSADITYTVTATAPCAGTSVATLPVTITKAPIAGTISGIQTVCITSTTDLDSDGDIGGSWTSADTAIATVDAAGVVTGVGAGTVNIIYTVTGLGGCADATALLPVTVKGPNPGTLSGNQGICMGGTTAISSSGDAGGSWSSSDTAVATVDAAGVVTAVAAGSATITYTVLSIGSCPNAKANIIITVTAPSNAGTVSGNQVICTGAPTTFTSNGDTGGFWSSSDTSVATADAVGVVTGVATGTATINYTITGIGGCPTVTDALAVNVTKAPNAGSISGTSAICMGMPINFTSDGDTGGLWSSSDTSVATVDAAGIVTGVGPGNTTITYGVTGTGGCTNVTGTLAVAVTKAPNAGSISGAQAICTGSPNIFTSNGDTGGSWSSSDTSVATVDAAGVVTGVASGIATISYTITGIGGCTDAIAILPINVTKAANAGTLSGTQNICAAGTTTITSDGDTGGVWSSSDTSIATVDATGIVTGVGAGTATITYVVTGTGGCLSVSATIAVTVTKAPNAGLISGAQAICTGSPAIFTSNGDTGGSWSSSDTSMATVDAAGVVTGVAGGNATISYTVNGTGGCINATAVLAIDVTKAPNAGTLSGILNICGAGTTSIASDGDTGGAWSSSDTAIATVDATGLVTAVSPGTANIAYTVTGISPCTNASASVAVSIKPILNINGGTLSAPNICPNTNQNITISNFTSLQDGIYSITYTLGGAGTLSESKDIPFSNGSASLSFDGSLLTNSGTVSITITDIAYEGGICPISGLSIATSFEIYNVPSPAFNIKDDTFCNIEPLTIANLTATITNGVIVKWYDAAVNGTELNESTPVVNNKIYYAAGISAEGCENQTRVAVPLLIQCDIVAPDGFSPNGDGINDTFMVPNLAIQYPDFKLEIYNRYGNMVYEGDKNTPDWEGTTTVGGLKLGNNVLPNGVYFYIISFNDGDKKPVQGRVYLNR